MYCICGQEIQSSSATPWQSSTVDSEGKVIRGVCLHGVAFDFEEFRLEDEVEVLKDAPGSLMTWKGVKGVIKFKSTSSIGVEIETCCYGKVTIWILPENLKKVK